MDNDVLTTLKILIIGESALENPGTKIVSESMASDFEICGNNERVS